MYAIFALIGVFVMLFLLCAVLFPELVGIAGKKTAEIERDHHLENAPENVSKKDSHS